ncbi:MAG: ABC transporter permease [Pygmaiobacter massiliensis]|nr:ABC transporter permease [Pygmaiobacter massiliensis]
MQTVKKVLGGKFLVTVFSILLSFVVGAVFLAAMGISPTEAYAKLFSSIFGTTKNMAYCVVYGTPLIFTGLAVAFSFRTGVFNIGAEGQFVVGSMAACVVGILVPAPSVVLIPLCLLAAAAAGAVWGLIVAFLKVKWGINEVLSMIMFNWIAYYLSNYIAGLEAIHNEGNAEATKNVQDAARILLPQSMLDALCPAANWGIVLALVATVIIYIIIEKTTLGYELKAVGFNRSAAEYGGINVNRSIYTAMAISGALAGLGGAVQLLGMGARISIFTSQEGFGFQGISAALIGASNPIGVFFAGIFYGALKYGGSKLNLIGAPSEVINIIMGTVVFFIAISHVFKLPTKAKKGGKQ